MKENSLFTKCWRFLRDEDGPTAVEYAVILALIVAACFAAIGSLGVEVGESFQITADKYDEINNP